MEIISNLRYFQPQKIQKLTDMWFIFAALLCCSFCYISAEVLPLSVEGNQILIGGKPGSLIGNSLSWSNFGWKNERFYNKEILKWLKKDWKTNVIRAAMGVEYYGGYLEEPEKNLVLVKTVVDGAIESDMYVIIDWHTNYCHQKEAIEFFEKMARIYGNKTNVIYELYNEPKNDVTWDKDVKPCVLAMIKAIRAIDKDNLIIVGTTNWCQDVEVAAADPITGYENIAYALHFYAGSPGHKGRLRKKAVEALEKNKAIFVTEWGAVNINGTRVEHKDTLKWFKFMKAHNLSNVNWSISDKAEMVSSLNPGASSEGGWKEEDLSITGKFVRRLIRSWYKMKV